MDNDFSRIRLRGEIAGNVLSLAARVAGIEENENGNYDIFGVQFSQYVKFDGDYIKHWQYDDGNVFAIRAFGGIAIPYGNAKYSIHSQFLLEEQTIMGTGSICRRTG